jgi:chemotaxis protein CheC
MELTSSQKDALTEVINIAYARAAGALSELSGHRIHLEVPKVAVHQVREIAKMLKDVIQGEVVSVNQVFAGPISGNAILILDLGAALLLNRLLTDAKDSKQLDAAGREAITEVGNILLNACLGVFGNLLQVQVSFTVPGLQVESIQEILSSLTIEENSLQYALMIHTRFHLRTSDVSGYMVIILGITSLERLLHELRKWEERLLA